MKRICCIGVVTTDILVKPVDSLPAPGVLQQVDSVAMHMGGCASNAAADLAILGIPQTLITKVGNDSFGRFVTEYLMEKGVALDGVRVDPSVATTVSVVCVAPNGERSFLYNPSSNDAISLGDIDRSLVKRCDIVFVAGALLMRQFDGTQCASLLRDCRLSGQYTVMDTAWDFRGRWLDGVRESLAHLDLFMPSYAEAREITGRNDPAGQAEFLIDLGVQNVVIKLGADGAFVREADGECYRVDSYRVDKPADTTGAGDSFCAGFLAGLANDLPYRDCARLGNAVGAHCVTAIGATSGIRPYDEMIAFIQQRAVEEC